MWNQIKKQCVQQKKLGKLQLHFLKLLITCFIFLIFFNPKKVRYIEKLSSFVTDELSCYAKGKILKTKFSVG